MPIKILASADLHLGRKSSAVPSGVEEASTRYTWQRMVDWAVNNDADILILSGDIVDKDNRYFEAIGPLQSGFDKLNKNGISVFLVAGNHDFDVLTDIINTNGYEHVHLLGSGGNWENKIYQGNNGSIQFVGWSFPKKYVREDPMTKFSQVELNPDELTIGLIHGEIGVPDSNYGPIELHELENAGPDIWLPGHIHKPVELNKDTPYIAYPGTPHALNSGEEGAHGPLLLEVDGKNDLQVRRIPLSPVRYEMLKISVEPSDDETALRDSLTSEMFSRGKDLLPELEQVKYLVFDIELEGTSASVNELDNWTAKAVEDYQPELENGTMIMVRKVINYVQPAVENLEELAEIPSPAGKLAESILALQKGENTPFLQKLTEEWKKKQQRLNKAGPYYPLYLDGRLVEHNDQLAREYILRECNRLLNTLLNQQEK